MLIHSCVLWGEDFLDLYEIIRRQLRALEQWADIPDGTSSRLNSVFEVLARESLSRPACPPFGGLARINPDGLPFQWSLCIDNKKPTVRFLCESGMPGSSARLRYRLSMAKYKKVCDMLEVPYPEWLSEVVLRHTMPEGEQWPCQWYSAIWFAVGAGENDILVKVYLNIRTDDALKRWKKIGWVLKMLGMENSLMQLCDLSGKVSMDSWPSGLAVDILPNGKAGRVKVYFESAEVNSDWLEKWYKATGEDWVLPYVRKMMEVFPRDNRLPYPEKAFFVSLEFSPGGEVSIKTDFTVSKWMQSDIRIVEGVSEFLDYSQLDTNSYLAWLEAMGAWPPKESGCETHQLVGFGFEPDGEYHVNVYCKPPLVMLKE